MRTTVQPRKVSPGPQFAKGAVPRAQRSGCTTRPSFSGGTPLPPGPARHGIRHPRSAADTDLVLPTHRRPCGGAGFFPLSLDVAADAAGGEAFADTHCAGHAGRAKAGRLARRSTDIRMAPRRALYNTPDTTPPGRLGPPRPALRCLARRPFPLPSQRLPQHGDREASP